MMGSTLVNNLMSLRVTESTDRGRYNCINFELKLLIYWSVLVDWLIHIQMKLVFTMYDLVSLFYGLNFQTRKLASQKC